MIFFTVGYQMSFDRMTKTVDEWAGRNPCEDIFAQIGPTSYLPRHVNYTTFMRPNDFVKQVQGASVVVAHAGMGSILSALSARKPLLVVPRRADLREHTNDHQMGCSLLLAERGLITVAWDLKELSERLDHLMDVSAVPKSPGRLRTRSWRRFEASWPAELPRNQDPEMNRFRSAISSGEASADSVGPEVISCRRSSPCTSDSSSIATSIPGRPSIFREVAIW